MILPNAVVHFLLIIMIRFLKCLLYTNVWQEMVSTRSEHTNYIVDSKNNTQKAKSAQPAIVRYSANFSDSIKPEFISPKISVGF